jgi:hypothetical protein
MADAWQNERALLNITNIFDEYGTVVDDSCFKIPVLLFRFSKINCSKCVVEQINLIKKMITDEQVKYMMIADYADKKTLGLFKRVNAIKSTVYNCKTMLISETRTPFFCVYSQGVITDVFFPDDDFPDLTTKYLETVKKKYFSGNVTAIVKE